MNKAGPYMHPAYPHLAFAAVVSPPPSENVASTFVFYLWDRGVASFYRYVPKKAGDTTPGLLFQVLSNPSKWAPTDPGVRSRIHLFSTPSIHWEPFAQHHSTY